MGLTKRHRTSLWTAAGAVFFFVMVKLLWQPMLIMIYFWVTLATIGLGGDVYEVLESEQYQSYVPPVTNVETEMHTIDGEVFDITLTETSVLSMFPMGDNDMNEPYVLSRTMEVENAEGVVLKATIPFTYETLGDAFVDATYSQQNNLLMTVWYDHIFMFHFTDEIVSVNELEYDGTTK